jgi:WD40 repeat protein
VLSFFASGPDDGYFFQNIDYQFKAAGRTEELRRLLLDFRWIRAKSNATHIADVIDDYEAFPADEPLRTVQQALRLSGHSVARDKDQLPSQFYGRLLPIELPEIQQLARQMRKWQGNVWLQPLTLDLTAPGGTVVLTLEGHTDAVRGVAVTANGRTAVSASADRTLRVWDLATGRTVKTLDGHGRAVNCVSVDHDGRLAISAAYDMEAKIWDLRPGAMKWVLRGSNCSEGVALSGDGRVAITARRSLVWGGCRVTSGKRPNDHLRGSIRSEGVEFRDVRTLADHQAPQQPGERYERHSRWHTGRNRPVSRQHRGMGPRLG